MAATMHKLTEQYESLMQISPEDAEFRGARNSLKPIEPEYRIYRQRFLMLLFSNSLFVCAIVYLLVTKVYQDNCSPTGPTHTPTPFGIVPLKMVKFEHNHSFDGNPSLHDIPWNTMNPPGRGFIVVQHPTEYSLAPGTPLDQPYRNGYVSNGSIPESGYLPSVFHQLHCMALLKKALAEVRHYGSDAVEKTKMGQDQPAEIAIRGLTLKHLDHCVEYVRQALMCAGDTTLEPAEVDDDGNLTHSSSGWGTEHLCRSWEYIYDYSFKHRVSDVTGITG